MQTVCSLNQCTGCNACVGICSKQAIVLEDSIRAYNAIIDEGKCIDCGLCQKVCPNMNPVELKEPVNCRQGWANSDLRSYAASGGIASAIMVSFVEEGGYVCSCLFEKGEFKFCITNEKEIIKEFAGSKYVKSSAGAVYLEVKQLLRNGKSVLFVGLPCQVAALKNICGEYVNLFTIDLICHGTPSPKLLKKCTEDSGISWNQVRTIKFRENNSYGLSVNGTRLSFKRTVDSYMLMFLKSISYTENCYSCRYATLNRVSDVTLGDAWGGLADRDPKGVSLVLCQTLKGEELLNKASIHLQPMDLDVAVSYNHQLHDPALKNKAREKFFYVVENGKSFRMAAFAAMPILLLKQTVKYFLIKNKLLKDF